MRINLRKVRIPSARRGAGKPDRTKIVTKIIQNGFKIDIFNDDGAKPTHRELLFLLDQWGAEYFKNGEVYQCSAEITSVKTGTYSTVFTIRPTADMVEKVCQAQIEVTMAKDLKRFGIEEARRAKAEAAERARRSTPYYFSVANLFVVLGDGTAQTCGPRAEKLSFKSAPPTLPGWYIADRLVKINHQSPMVVPEGYQPLTFVTCY